MIRFPKPTHDINTGKKIHYRKEFKRSTKKVEWNRAAGRVDDDFKTTSKCRKCSHRFVWGEGGYQFDHFDNKSANNRQSNCRLVCATCHSKATRTGKRAIKGVMGQIIGHKTIKYKAGYKRVKKAKKRKTVKKKAHFYDPAVEYSKIQKQQEKAWKKISKGFQ